MEWSSGPWFSIKLWSYQYMESPFGDDRLISTMGFPILIRRDKGEDLIEIHVSVYSQVIDIWLS